MDKKPVVFIVYSITPEWYDTGLEIHHEIHRVFSDCEEAQTYFKSLAGCHQGRVWLEGKVVE